MLGRLDAGASSSERVDSTAVELKEEAGRRRHGEMVEGQRHQEEAVYLTGEAVCMASSASGGLLVGGVGRQTLTDRYPA